MNLLTSVEQPEEAPRDAASIIVLRPAASGFDVLLMRRHGNSKVLGGAYVFPGGKLDADDRRVPPERLAQTGQALCEALGESGTQAEDAQSLFSAAIRETLEECGILYLEGADQARAEAARQALSDGLSWSAWAAQQDGMLLTSSLVPWSRWITPKASLMMSKRFDTRFFVAVLPANQSAIHDGHEATALEWLTPQAALALYEQGEIDMAPPQIMTLLDLSRFSHPEQVLDHARGRPAPLIQPYHFEQDGARVLAFPGDEQHELRSPAWPGSTRIYYRNGRFGDASGSVLAMLNALNP